MGKLLNNIRIASPCPADWDKMIGDDRVRHCSQCNLNVYNLSTMSVREAEELVLRREGRMCVRFYCRTDGTKLTRNCPVGLKAVMHRVSRVAGIALAAAMSAVPLAAQTQRAPERAVQLEETALKLEVVDFTGAVCYGAKVQLKNESTHKVISATTDNDGRLRLSGLSAGTYTLAVTYPNFERYEQEVVIHDRKIAFVTAMLQVNATVNQGVIVEATVINVEPDPVVETPPLTFSPLPVPDYPKTRHGFFHRIFDKLFHHPR